MSIYLSFDGAEPQDWCSNRGHGDLCRWIDGLDGGAVPQLAHLREYGWCQKLGDLEAELGRTRPPADAPTRAVVESLKEAVRGRGKAEVLSVTNGVSASGGIW